MIIRTLILTSTLALPLAAVASTPVSSTDARQEVRFTHYPAFARNGELLRRLVSPLNAMRIRQKLAPNSNALGAQPLDPSRQRFALYVPPGAPPAAGYALLVFVPPWNDARVPPQWIPVFDRQYTIFVSAADSGNDADVFNRREPLALLAAYNVMRRYHVDPARVYVGGFSGGARVALRLALGYPDLFRGALLDAGSDPIGTTQVPLPPVELLHHFQQSTRIVFLAGTDDRGPAKVGYSLVGIPIEPSQPGFREKSSLQGAQSVVGIGLYARGGAQAQPAVDSLRKWCVQDGNVDVETLQDVGHEPAAPAALERALIRLGRPGQIDEGRLASCRAGIGERLDTQIKHARSLLDHGMRDDARVLLERIDAQYGGLAAPQTVELMHELDAGH